MTWGGVMAFEEDRTWVGAGAKVGGIAVIGMETVEGVVARLDDMQSSWTEINITSLRLGLGLGGSAGAVIICAFNVTGVLYTINGLSVSDWGATLALPEVKESASS